MNVVFVNENQLGHASYLLPFIRTLDKRRELGIVPHQLDATPLPEAFARRANWSIRGVRKWGLDFHATRWRKVVSEYVGQQLSELRQKQQIDAVVVNTQSVGLALTDLATEVPVFLCMDATFRQLTKSRWFCPNLGSRVLAPLTTAAILSSERRIVNAARGLFAWSAPVSQSLVNAYHVSPNRISLLPPSIQLPEHERRATSGRPEILFVGGDFYRKGGMMLLDCYKRFLAGRCDLHIITESTLAPTAGVFVHRGLKPFTDPWLERWRRASLFVFPSHLETFGIVLLEALAFGVPVISSDVGAAREILRDGQAGWLMTDRNPESWGRAIRQVLDDPRQASGRVEEGRRQVAANYDLSRNAERLAERLLHAVH